MRYYLKIRRVLHHAQDIFYPVPTVASMKWITHEAVAVGSAFLLGMPPVALAGVAFGSVLPDVLDQSMARTLVFRNLAFNKLHRGVTHWFGWWLAFFFAGLLQQNPAASAWFITGTAFGGLIHVVLDLFTVGGVPLAPWSRKHMISLKLCKTGSLQEYLFLAAASLLFLIIAWEDLGGVADEARLLFRTLRQGALSQ